VSYIITLREAFRFKNEGHGATQLSSLQLDRMMKVPLTQSLDDLFEKFQKSRKHIALVLDEHGGTAGVVTMEDVLEEVFGDIKDEKDQEAIYVRRKSDTLLEVVGKVLIDDVLEEFNISAESFGIPYEYIGEPVSYVILSEEEEFPTQGSEVIFQGTDGQITLRVIQLDGTVIQLISCELIKA